MIAGGPPGSELFESKMTPPYEVCSTAKDTLAVVLSPLSQNRGLALGFAT